MTQSAGAAKGANRPAAPIAIVVERLAAAYPTAECALHHRNAFELLAATILSAQCTDERVNAVTPKLFARFPNAAALARADRDELEALVRPTGFYRNKAKSLLGMAEALVRHHGGEVPRSLPALIELPGVARKTANVVLGVAFGITSGVVVDTHVRRLSGLLGLTAHEDPVDIEQDLMTLLPESEWILFGHRLIHHGRQVCVARRPRCTECNLADVCPSAFA